MPSQLNAIYNAVAAIDMTIDGVTVDVRSLNVDPVSVVNETPVRMLSPLNDRNEGRGLSVMTFGGGKSVVWSITDLLLLAGVTEGSSLEYYAPQLVTYQREYVDAFTDRRLGLSNISVQQIDIEIGIYQFPAEVGGWYFGCKATWDIRELI